MTHPDRKTPFRLASHPAWTRSLGLVMAAAGIVLFVGRGLEATSERAPRSGAAELAAKRVERGAYLVSVIGCADCHTPLKMGERGPEPDLSRAFSGHPQSVKVGPPPAVGSHGWEWAGSSTMTAFHGPWGTSYAANLTPDVDTGLGIWTEDMFLRAIRTGKHFGEPTSRDIQPPMPWFMYKNATDEDLRSIFAFLRTVKPVRNHVPAYAPPARG